MKYLIGIFVIVVVSTSAFGQLTTIQSQTGINMGATMFHSSTQISSVVKQLVLGTKETRSLGVLDYDATSTAIGFSFIRKTDIITGINSNNFYNSRIFSAKINVGLNEETFTIFNKTLKPGFDISIDHSWQLEGNVNKPSFWLLGAGLKNENSLVKNAIVEIDTVLSFNEQWTNQAQVLFHVNHVHIDPIIGVKWIAGIGLNLGYEFNSTSHLDERLFCKTTGQRLSVADETGYYDRLNCKERFDGKLQNVRQVKLTGFWSHRVKSFDTNDLDYLSVVVIPSIELKDKNIPSYSISAGLSLNKFPRKVMTSILFQGEDLLKLTKKDNDLSDVFSVRLFFGIPIGF